MVVWTQEVVIKMGRTVQIKVVDRDICTRGLAEAMLANLVASKYMWVSST